MNKSDLALYLVTDRDLMSTKTLPEAVEAAIQGGVTFVQLREKNSTSAGFYKEALAVKEITDRYGVPLIINDRLDIAMAVHAAGVHLGQQDLPAAAARQILGPDYIIGVSAATVEEAVKAEADGADYLGIGAMFPTETKTNTRRMTNELLSRINASVSIPSVAIGGINESNILTLAGTGIAGVAVVSAIIAKPDIKAAAETLKKLTASL